MSYVKTVKILDAIKISDIDSNADNIYSTLRNGIQSVTGWEIIEGSNCKFRISPNLTIYFDFIYSSSSSRYHIFYHFISTNSNGSTSRVEGVFAETISSTSAPLYICYCKSKSGNTIAIDIKTSALTSTSIPNFVVVVAEDVNGDYAGIGLASAGTESNILNAYCSEMTWKGYKCYLSNKVDGSYKGQLQYLATADTVVTTSLCKLPNYLSGCLFKELYMILSCPVNYRELYTVVLDIEGKKYQGISYAFSTQSRSSSCAILAG